MSNMSWKDISATISTLMAYGWVVRRASLDTDESKWLATKITEKRNLTQRLTFNDADLICFARAQCTRAQCTRAQCTRAECQLEHESGDTL